MPTCAFSTFGNIILMYHSEAQPAEAEWRAYAIALCTLAEQSDKVFSLAMSDGGGPTASQRSLVMKGLGNNARKVVSVVFTDSILVRGMITAFGWLGGNIKGYKPADLVIGLRSVGLALEHHARVAEAFEALKTEVHTDSEPQSAG